MGSSSVITDRSAVLSGRSRQPGHDRSFRRSESLFIASAREALDPDLYEVVERPKHLRDIFPPLSDSDRPLGVVPEAAVISRRSGRMFFVEVKKQGDSGNAEERAAKHHTVGFYRLMRERFGYDFHPYVTVFCESLAENPRYTRKIQMLLEPDQFLLWRSYDPALLEGFLTARCAAWLDPA